MSSTFQNVTHCIFDLDGLLLDTEALYPIITQNIIDRTSNTRQLYTKDLQIQMAGLPMEEEGRRIVEIFNLPITADDYVRMVLELDEVYLKNCRKCEGAERLVKHLVAHKIPICVATSSSKESFGIKTTNHKEFFELFHHIVTGSSDADVKRGKPFPDIFFVAASRFPNNPKPENCLVFEDALNGVKAARDAGMQVVMVPDPHVSEDQKLDATQVLKSLVDFKPEDFGLPRFSDQTLYDSQCDFSARDERLQKINDLVKMNETQTNATTYYKVNYHYTSINHLEKGPQAKRRNMHGVKRVIAFCCLTTVVPTILIITPLYLKHQVFKDIVYSVAESDILEVRDGISTIFCQQHTLKMNSTFNAFQLNHMPNQSKTRKHIRLKKSMSLPDDTLEYWGFYLMKGATVELKVCSRVEGSRILVVKGERNLRTCGLLEHNQNKFGAAYNPEKSQVHVTFEEAQVIEPGITVNEENVRLNEELPGDLDDEAKFNNGGEDLSDFDEEIQRKRKDFSKNYLKHEKNEVQNVTTDGTGESEKRRKVVKRDFARQHNKRHSQHKMQGRRASENNARQRRDTILDRGINHGGNAHTSLKNQSSSTSSFENALLECYDGQILVSKYFPPSKNCTSVEYLDHGAHLISRHEVLTDGYYYYIFYSDNDDESNDIHAIFDIQKPTYLYSNISETKGCINSTECHFPIQMFSDEIVIVEVPTRDGIEHEDDDITFLISQCLPRMSVYVIFPLLVLVFILGCAFI